MKTRKITKDTHPYPNFFNAAIEIGPTSSSLARALGVSERAATNYLNGSSLPSVKIVKRHPTIDAALTLDLAPRSVKTPRQMQEIAENSS